MKVFDFLRSRLPEGLDLVGVKWEAGVCQWQGKFSYCGVEVGVWMPKLWPDDFSIKVCEKVYDIAICQAMINVALEMDDNAMAFEWHHRMNEIYGIQYK